MKDPAPGDRHPSRSALRPTSRLGWLVVLLWLAATALCAQFALASADELEPQAAFLGWVLVSILLVGGLGVWSGSLQDGRHRHD